MDDVKAYYIKPTKLVPNSHLPLLHYRQAFKTKTSLSGDVFDTFSTNGWETQWINRYGPTQPSHYHSAAHECMAVLSGHATIRFGVADLSDDLDANTTGSSWEDGGIELQAQTGDVFVIPAGVAHKTYNASPTASFETLTPGGGKSIAAADVRSTIDNTQLSGFTMLGAYPFGSSWDFKTGDSDHESWEKIWSVEKPRLDPILGETSGGLCTLWQDGAANAHDA